jgi:hypothetical protein
MSVGDMSDLQALKQPSDIGRKCDIRISQQRYKNGRPEITVKDGLEPDMFDEDNSYALVAKKIFTEKNVLESTTVRINSPHLLQAFRQLVESYPTVPSDFEEPFELESPFQILFHYWEDIVEYRRMIKDDTARMHLSLLLDFMKSEVGEDKIRCDFMIKKNQITFSQLWALYRPGDLQYTSSEGHPWLLTVSKTAYEENAKLGKFLEVHCTYTDYDGTHIGLANRVFKIYQKMNFAAHNPAIITDLDIFPRKFVKDKDDLEEELWERGSRFLQLKGVLVRIYKGIALYLKDPPIDFYDPGMADWPGVWLPYTVSCSIFDSGPRVLSHVINKESDRIVIDRKTFQEENHLEQVAIRPPRQGDDEERISTIQCPPFVHGFSLARKEWCRFYVDQIHPIEWNEDLFNSLVIGDSQKLLLRALVTSHAFLDKSGYQIQQKGKGLVILLHGTPGSGKTLTAGKFPFPVAQSGSFLLNVCRICGRDDWESITLYYHGRDE